MPRTVADVLAAHMGEYPPVEITIPWGTPTGAPITVSLMFATPDGQPITRMIWSDLWQSIAKRAGCPGVRISRPEALRDFQHDSPRRHDQKRFKPLPDTRTAS